MKTYLKTIKKVMLLLALTAIVIACNEDNGSDGLDIETIPELITDAPFVRFPTEFVFPPTISLANADTGEIDPTVATIDIDLSEANGPGTVASYTLAMTANLSDGVRIIEDFLTITDFPTTVTISATSIAMALEVDPASLNFGDSFEFVATAVGTNGIVAIGTEPSFDDGFVGSGNVDAELLNADGNNGAMNFSFTFACPPFPVSDAVGVYDVVFHTYVANFGFTGDDPITITLDPDDPNKLVLSPIQSFHNGGPITITVDGSTGGVTYTEEEAEIVFDDFDLDGSVGSVGGLVLPCADQISLSIVPSCCIPNQLILSRQ